MRNFPNLTQPATYRIRFAGRIKNGWSDFMTGFHESFFQKTSENETELEGEVRDQSALFGLLCHIRDLSLPLISVEFIRNSKGEGNE